MKKFMLLLVVLASLPVANLSSKSDIGIIGGLNLASAKLEPSDDFDVDNISTLNIGLFTHIKFNKNVGLQITPMYMEKGVKARADFNFLEFSEFRVDFFEIPVLARVTLLEGPIQPYAVFGPSIGFKLSATGSGSNGSDESDISGELQNVDFSIVAGAGLQLDADKIAFFGQVTYMHGIKNLDNSDGFFDFTEEIYSRNIGINVGLLVHLGKDEE